MLAAALPNAPDAACTNGGSVLVIVDVESKEQENDGV